MTNIQEVATKSNRKRCALSLIESKYLLEGIMEVATKNDPLDRLATARVLMEKLGELKISSIPF